LPLGLLRHGFHLVVLLLKGLDLLCSLLDLVGDTGDRVNVNDCKLRVKRGRNEREEEQS